MSIRKRQLAPPPAAADPEPGFRPLDEAGLAAAFREHRQAIIAVARGICGPQHAADVAQEVFLALWRRPTKYDPTRGPLRPFLLALTRNKAVDVLRRETARQAREHREHVATPPATVAVEDALLRGDAATQVRVALNGLPAKERQAITTAFYGGYTYRQAAAMLGEPEGTIKSRIRCGLQRLRPTLEELGGLPPSASIGTRSQPQRLC